MPGHFSFGRHLSLTDTLGLDLMLGSIQCQTRFKLLYYECQKYEIMTICVVGGQPRKLANPSHKATKQNKRTFLISDYY